MPDDTPDISDAGLWRMWRRDGSIPAYSTAVRRDDPACYGQPQSRTSHPAFHPASLQASLSWHKGQCSKVPLSLPE